MHSRAQSEPGVGTVPRSRPVAVAVIDSGIHPGHRHVQHVDGGVAIPSDGESGDFVDRIGHGTAVAAAICEKAPEARLYAIKVFDQALAVGVGTLVRAIDWAVDHGCEVINLSLGTTKMEHEPRLRPPVARARARGAVVVAALEDNGQRWLPGCLRDVIGVTVDWDIPRERVRFERMDGRLVCRASGYPRDIPGVPRARNLMGISFAVANASGIIALALGHSTGRPGDLETFLLDERDDAPWRPEGRTATEARP